MLDDREIGVGWKVRYTLFKGENKKFQNFLDTDREHRSDMHPRGRIEQWVAQGRF